MSKKVLAYITVVDTETKGLDKQVSEYLKEGFQPFGSPYVLPGDKPQICQVVALLGDEASGMELPG